MPHTPMVPRTTEATSEATRARREFAQSRAIHPDWTAEDHLSYLENDAFIDTALAGMDIHVVRYLLMTS